MGSCINIFHTKTDYTSYNISILLVEDCTVYKIKRFKLEDRCI